MDKQRIVEIIALGRVRNLSDEQIAEMVIEAMGGKKSAKKQASEQQEQPVDSVGD